MEYPIIKVFLPAIMAFVIGIAITPLITHYLFKYKVWKKQGGKTAMGGHEATEFNRLKGEGEVKTPRMGGIVILVSTLFPQPWPDMDSGCSPCCWCHYWIP
jgi:UDP-N-acetylmuramyl pentapeptide phosphotransferase/UDP-N-acetylglucosamine-1-phosphate transferase